MPVQTEKRRRQWHHELAAKCTPCFQQQDFRPVIIPVTSRVDSAESLQKLTAAASSERLGEIEMLDLAPILDELLRETETEYSELFWRYDGHFNSLVLRSLGVRSTEHWPTLQLKSPLVTSCRTAFAEPGPSL